MPLTLARMKDVLGLVPRYTTPGAFQDFVNGQGLHGPLSRENVDAVEQRLVSVLGQVASRG